ncbi:glucan biosynthesis protein [Roseobacter sinensis]|uniref:Glucan biosynthesis protein G n=1 Tax=Roseobacter sinensis TaxID=2931391 RepID=A0ABT3BIG8_9RHOB|nr:glucan biosynthesis protein G [Roseobacter sp. WL0113]MCV3273371.1 glucan biosynthesis protein G [Roseobacter sp. WL0113]
MILTQTLSRRHVLAGLLLSTALAPNLPAAQTAAPTETPFSFEDLKREMKTRAALPDTPPALLDTFLDELSYDDYRNIYFRPEAARLMQPVTRFRLEAFHPGWLYKKPVKIHEIVDGVARPLTFSTKDFEYRNEVAEKLPEAPSLPGVAGVKINTPFNTAEKYDELITFLGASYFRALGAGNSYGLSARGLAVNTWRSGPEEFPRFSAFWIQRPTPEDSAIEVYAALDSASVTGAYRFVIAPGADTVIDVEAELYFRETVPHLGLAPLTSMFYFAEHSERRFDDFRPQVHDSDLLRMVRTSGDVLVRPLNNPPRVSNSFFADDEIIEFGLVQRDRSYEAYQDAGAQYHDRPSVMIDRVGDWGPGKIRLIEIPAKLEIDDNIVLLWVPDEAPQAGETRNYRYRMHWGALPADGNGELAYVYSTRTGVGGASGVPVENPNLRKFVIDFQGGTLGGLNPEAQVIPVVTASAGEISNPVLHKIDDADQRWRLFFDVDGQDAELIELVAHVADQERKLSEVWLFQWVREVTAGSEN